MSNEFIKTEDIDEIAQQAESGADVSRHFTGRFLAKQRIDIVFPLDLLQSIDADCQRQQIARQDWIESACAAKIREARAAQLSENV